MSSCNWVIIKEVWDSPNTKTDCWCEEASDNPVSLCYTIIILISSLPHVYLIFTSSLTPAWPSGHKTTHLLNFKWTKSYNLLNWKCYNLVRKKLVNWWIQTQEEIFYDIAKVFRSSIYSLCDSCTTTWKSVYFKNHLN